MGQKYPPKTNHRFGRGLQEHAQKDSPCNQISNCTVTLNKYVTKSLKWYESLQVCNNKIVIKYIYSFKHLART